MIVIDVPMPGRCATCPCAERNAGKQQDRMKCRAMEAAGRKYVLVNEFARQRPEDCPIRLEVLRD